MTQTTPTSTSIDDKAAAWRRLRKWLGCSRNTEWAEAYQDAAARAAVEGGGVMTYIGFDVGRETPGVAYIPPAELYRQVQP